jgi:uncharacterized integral membrane protein
MQVQKLKLNNEPKTTPKKGASRETLFRVTLRNQLRAIGITDQKAKVLIGINTILISLLITVMGLVSNLASFQFINYLDLSLPFMIMVVSCFISGAIAITAVKPNPGLWKKDNPSLLSFRDFQGTRLEDFLEDMDEILSSKKNIYKSLSIDLYLYGKCLQKKNQLLRHAFNIFLGGLTVAVIAFGIMRMTATTGVA